MELSKIIDYWNNNCYSRVECINYLEEWLLSKHIVNDNIFNNLDWLKTDIITEEEAIECVKVFTDLIKDKETLKSIACILAGEYLTEDINSLVKIIEYHDWKIDKSINVFISWYYKLCDNNLYYQFVKKEFISYKIKVILNILLTCIGCLIAPISTSLLLLFIDYYVLPRSVALFLSVFNYVLLMFSLLSIILLLRNKHISVIFRFHLVFKFIKL